jgi:hypothetical protein
MRLQQEVAEAVVEAEEALDEAEDPLEDEVVAVMAEDEEEIVFNLMSPIHVGNLDLVRIPMMNGTISLKSKNQECLILEMQQTPMILMHAA